ncbi:MAG: hypothetical protein WC005_00210 [Candidatus Nanopelagicales bacterium]
MDDSAARAEGFPAAIGMGNYQWAILHRMLRGYTGPNGVIVRVEIKFRRPNVKGQILTPMGRVTSVDGRVIGLDVWTEDQTGARLGEGTAQVVLAA